MGSGPADVVPVRIDPELRAAIEARGKAKHTTTSEIIRAAIRRFLEVATGDQPTFHCAAHLRQGARFSAGRVDVAAVAHPQHDDLVAVFIDPVEDSIRPVSGDPPLSSSSRRGAPTRLGLSKGVRS